jgi:hypothetical protein
MSTPHTTIKADWLYWLSASLPLSARLSSSSSSLCLLQQTEFSPTVLPHLRTLFYSRSLSTGADGRACRGVIVTCMALLHPLPKPDKGHAACVEWDVHALPDGLLTHTRTRRQHSSLYWEAQADAGVTETFFTLVPSTGFCVKGEEAGDWLDKVRAGVCVHGLHSI